MPYSPPTVCSTPGCGGRRKGGVCSKCGPRKRQQDTRKHAAARGYDYRWQKFREQYLAQHPLCVDCSSEGMVGAARHIHHIEKLRDRPDLKYEATNLMPLCEHHHDKRTARGE